VAVCNRELTLCGCCSYINPVGSFYLPRPALCPHEADGASALLGCCPSTFGCRISLSHKPSHAGWRGSRELGRLATYPAPKETAAEMIETFKAIAPLTPDAIGYGNGPSLSRRLFMTRRG
jgi:hypothetical protein